MFYCFRALFNLLLHIHICVYIFIYIESVFLTCVVYAGTVFDASQYAFFGKDVLEEVELGGLEDEEVDLPAAGFEEEEFLYDKEEVKHILNSWCFYVLFRI